MEPSTDEYSNHANKDDIQASSDELRNSCVLSDAGGCISIQEEIRECLIYIKTFINNKDFVQNVRNDSTKLRNIEEQLHHNLLDLKRTDCSIVFAGETSSGKSSIVNAIIEEKILPTGIEATTTRVCRVKYSKELKIATCDENDKMYREHRSFQNTKKMAEELKTIAQTNDQKITYVDIFMPLPFKQGNVAIVDTPGIGDIDQKEVAQKMMDYLPNALAFVFVINVAAAGGLQKDRFIPILEHVKKSLKEMVCFDHGDVIFLLNKWDTLLDDDQKDMFFETTKEHLRNIWKDVKPDRILKLSMNKGYGEHACLLESFKNQLEDVVEKNKKKRCRVHMRFLTEFISECEKIISPKLKRAIKNAKTSQSRFEDAMAEVSKLKKIRQEESLKLDEKVMCFIDAVTDQLHEYIHQPDFKENMLKNVAKSWRLKVNFDVKAHIETETKQWEERHMHKIYDDIFVKKLNTKLQKICGSLVENLLKGFKMPYDPENKIIKGVFFSAVSIAGGFVARALIFEPPVAVGVATFGIVFTGLLNFGYISDFKTVCEHAVNAGIETLSKNQIKQNLKERYEKALKKNVEEALKTMKVEIEKLEKEQQDKETENTVNNSKMCIYMSLDDKVCNCKERLGKIEKM